MPSAVLRSGGGTSPQVAPLAGTEVALVTIGCGTWAPD
jgi:hypothetical protein